MTLPKWKMVGRGFSVGGGEFGEIQVDELGVLIRVYPIGSEVFGRVGESGPDAAVRIVDRMNKLEAFAFNSAEDMRERVQDLLDSDDGLPADVQEIADQCVAGWDVFDNDQMSTVIHAYEDLREQLHRLTKTKTPSKANDDWPYPVEKMPEG